MKYTIKEENWQMTKQVIFKKGIWLCSQKKLNLVAVEISEPKNMLKFGDMLKKMNLADFDLNHWTNQGKVWEDGNFKNQEDVRKVSNQF